MTAYFVNIAQAILALMLAPALVGWVRWVKARLQNRQGAPFWLPYYELRKLFAKEVVLSPNASWLFRLAPYLIFATSTAVILLVPLIAVPLPFDAAGDLLLVVYLLLTGTFFLSLAGLDPGTAFGGMGASREMTVAAIAEPTLAVAIFTLAVPAGSTNLSQIVLETIKHPAVTISPGHILAFAALFIVALAECGRLPVDNPATHLELTMIHEAMILEYSGRYLALIEWTSWLRLLIFLSLLSNLFLPWGVATTLAPAAVITGFGFLVLKLAFFGMVIALLETRIAKLRLFRVPELLGVSFILAFLAVTSSFFLR